ncbi:MAG: hypothetical protein IJ419_01005 [Agathobacter sp.]|nr:hypothetical protein [Agathobacter sp.]
MKREMLKRFLAVFMAFSLTFLSIDAGCLTAMAADIQNVGQYENVVEAGDAETGKNIVQGATGYFDIGHEAGRVEDKNILSGGLPLNQTITIPEAYSSVTEGYVTSIKNQNPWGTCWSFAACAAMESYALVHGYVDDPADVDFSEYALVYMTYKDTLYSDITGDYTTADVSMETLFGAGGNNEYAFKALTKWAGIYNEGNDTYYADSVSTGNIAEYVANEENIDYVLTGQKYINMADANQVKAAVMENGALAVSYYSDDAYCTSDGIYNYNYELGYTNHAVTLVGWDDTISRDLFTMPNGSKPENDGAWLIKNSWGTWNGYDGYIWISYEDMGILASDAVIYEIAPKADFDNIYQHDGGTPYATYLEGYKFATIFDVTGDANQLLEAVSFALCSTDSSYTIDVYKTTEENTFVDGELLATVTGTTTYEGYYTAMLDTPVEVVPGDEITIIITFAESEYIIAGSNNFVMIGEYNDEGELVTPYSTVYSSSEVGQSYVGYGTEDNPYFSDLTGDSERFYHDLCIKAFTKDVAQLPEIIVSYILNYEYCGEAIEPQVTVTLEDGTELEENTDYTVTYKNNLNAGSATIVISFIGTYEEYDDIEKQFTIASISAEDITVEDIPDYIYTGSYIIPELTVTSKLGLALTEGVDYTVSYVNNKNAGTATAILSFKGNYTGEKEVEFTITPKSESGTVVEAIENQTYSGKAITPTVVVLDGNKTLVENTDYTVSYENNINAGPATVVITFIGNYSGSMEATFEIEPMGYSELDISQIPNKIYTGGEITLTEEDLMIMNGSTELVYGSDFVITGYMDNVNAGEASVSIEFTGNYKGNAEITFVIEPRPATDCEVSDIGTFIYSGNEIKPGVYVYFGEIELEKDVDYTVSYENNVNASRSEKAKIKITFIGNYSGSSTIEFEILPIKIDAEDLVLSAMDDIVFTGSEIVPNVEITYNDMIFTNVGEDAGVVIEFTEEVDHTNVGEQIPFTATLTGNYDGTITGTFNIVPMSANDLIIGSIANQKYTGEAITPDVVIKNGSITLAEGEDKDYTIEFENNTEIGKATVKITFHGNYDGERTVYFEIINPVPDQITSNDVTVNETTGYISKLSIGTTIKNFIDSLNEKEYIKVFKGDQEAEENDLLGTGMLAQIMDDDKIVKKYTVIVTGDTNGDGKISITDMLAVKASVLKKSNLTGAYEKAADVNGDGKITITDFIKTKAVLLKKDTITGITAQ